MFSDQLWVLLIVSMMVLWIGGCFLAHFWGFWRKPVVPETVMYDIEVGLGQWAYVSARRTFHVRYNIVFETIEPPEPENGPW